MIIGKGKPVSVLGHTISEPAPTAGAIVLLLLYVLLPVLVLGSFLDLLAQWMFGICVGLWCIAV
jgi:hypothetical protein